MEVMRALAGMTGNRLILPMWRTVSPSPLPYLPFRVETPERFQWRAEWLAKRFMVVDIQDVLDVVEGRKRFPKPAVFFSFQGGLSGTLSHALPILNKLDIPACVFASPDYLGNTHIYHKHIATWLSGYLLRRMPLSKHWRDAIRPIWEYPGYILGKNFDEQLQEDVLQCPQKLEHRLHQTALALEVDLKRVFAGFAAFTDVEGLKTWWASGRQVAAVAQHGVNLGEESTQSAQINAQLGLKALASIFAQTFPALGYDEVGGTIKNPKLGELSKSLIGPPTGAKLIFGSGGMSTKSNGPILQRIPMEKARWGMVLRSLA